MQNETTPDRSQQHAKLLTYKQRQVLVFLQRDNTDKLQVLLSIWSSASDAQVRALVEVETDDHAMVAFDSFTDETVAEFIEAAGMADVL
jgi:hypothetical protein